MERFRRAHCITKNSFNSPETTKMDAALPIFNNGSSDKDYDIKTHNSYGKANSPVLEVSIGVWCVDNFGANDNDDVWDVDYSYGKR